MNNKIKVLHYIPGFKFGGIESRMLEVFKGIDKTKYQLDFLILTSLDNYLVEEIKSNGGNVYQVPSFSPKNIINHIDGLKTVLSDTKYDIIHCHSSATGFVLLLLAKKQGIKGRIMHARTSSFAGSSVPYLRKLMQKISVHYSNTQLAVSQKAGDWAFGRKEFQVIPNSIDLDKFAYNHKDRNEVREFYSINNKNVFGHIGRNTYAKNHKFLFEIFSQIIKDKPNSVLLLVGVDNNEQNLNQWITELGIVGKVVFCGYQEDMSKYHSAMDVLIFPSFYEGLPGTLVEAQASGLKCYCSDVITKEVSLTENIEFIKLNEGAKNWSSKIIKSMSNPNRRSYIDEIKNQGFSIDTTVRMFEGLYSNIVK